MHDVVLEYEWELHPVTIEMMYNLAKAEARRQAWQEAIGSKLFTSKDVEYIPKFTSLIFPPATNT